MVVDEALNTSLVIVQDNTPGTAIAALGVVMLCVTVVETEVVHPLLGSATVTVYVEGMEIVWVAVVTPPPQLKLAPPVLDDAVKVSLVFVQVNTVGVAILAFGVVMFCVTVAVAIAVQPLPGLVTVTL